GKIARSVDDFSTDDSEIGSGIGDLLLRAGEIVTVGDDHVRKLTYLDAPLPALLVGEPGHVLSPHAQRGLAIEAVALRINPQAGYRPARRQPGERDPGIIGGNAGGIGAG